MRSKLFALFDYLPDPNRFLRKNTRTKWHNAWINGFHNMQMHIFGNEIYGFCYGIACEGVLLSNGWKTDYYGSLGQFMVEKWFLSHTFWIMDEILLFCSLWRVLSWQNIPKLRIQQLRIGCLRFWSCTFWFINSIFYST